MHLLDLLLELVRERVVDHGESHVGRRHALIILDEGATSTISGEEERCSIDVGHGFFRSPNHRYLEKGYDDEDIEEEWEHFSYLIR